MGRFKTGRLPGSRPVALADLEVYASALPTPPVSVQVPKASYPIDGNDEYGDCVMAGTAHLIEAWNVETKEHDFVPSSNEVVERYFNLTGGEDSGLSESNTLHAWYVEGMFKAKIAGYAPIKTGDLLNQHRGIAFYGGVMYGILCPESAQRQFEEQLETGKRVPWTYEGEWTDDGHCIVGLGYNKSGNVECATWGGIIEVTPGFWAHYEQECWVPLPHQLVEKGEDALGINTALLQKDLKLV